MVPYGSVVPNPRSWLQNPAYFSQDRHTWKTPANPAEHAEILAAKWQQNVARNLRTEAARQGLNLTQLAEAAGCSHDTVSRIINGEAWLNLRLIATFEECLHADLLAETRPDD